MRGKVVLRLKGSSVGAEEDFDLEGHLQHMHPMLGEVYDDMVEASLWPALILDCQTEWFRPEELAAGHRGRTVLDSDGSSVIQVSFGTAVLLTVCSTEAEGVVDVDYSSVHRAKLAPIAGRLFWKKPLPITFPEVVSRVRFGHSLDDGPVYLAGSGPRAGEWVMVQVEIKEVEN